jgi:nicotinate phosphoribosyltransferase
MRREVLFVRSIDINDSGLLDPGHTGLLIDAYELTMAASYLRRGMNERATFELFVRRLPPRRDWLMVAGVGPALELVSAMRFDRDDLRYLRERDFPAEFLDYLGDFRFTGDIDAMPEGTVVFANEPVVRVTAPRIEAQLLETILLNQLNFQIAIATKAARIVLAIGGGVPGQGRRLVDFSPRRDHGIDAAMKAARAAAVAGALATSNVAAAMRYGLTPAGTMAHSYVLSFPDEPQAFRAFMQDMPENAVLLVDTYDTPTGVCNAIDASRVTGVPLKGIRLDSGDLLSLSRVARSELDAAGMAGTTIMATGDLDEQRITGLVRDGAPIDLWGVGTDLGTSSDSPVVGGVYKLVAQEIDGSWHGVAKHSEGKETVAGTKQVFRRHVGDTMVGDVIAAYHETLAGRALLVRAMRDGRSLLCDSLQDIQRRAQSELAALPPALRVPTTEQVTPYPVEYSEELNGLTHNDQPPLQRVYTDKQGHTIDAP